MSYQHPRYEWPPKWPTEVLDYSLNWKEAPDTPANADQAYVAVLDAVAGETIVSIVHAIIETPDGDASNPLTIDSEAVFDTARQTVVWLSGGVPGKYVISATITTSESRTVYREAKLKIMD